jgi:hypothetical protein
MLLFSSLLTLIRTAGQLYYEYRKDLEHLEEQFSQIEKSRIQAVESCLWTLDTEMLRVQLDGILQLPAVTYVEVRNGSSTSMAVGAPGLQDAINGNSPCLSSIGGRRNPLERSSSWQAPKGFSPACWIERG